MRRTLLKIAVFALTFTLGAGIAIGWQLYQWSLVPYEVSPTPPWPLAPEQPPRVGKPEEVTVVGGIHACGGESNYHTMNLSDGTRISESYEEFPSRKAAASALQAKLLHAQIAERSLKRDENGEIISESILTAGPRVMRIEVFNKSLRVTDAPSLEYLRLYESGRLH